MAKKSELPVEAANENENTENIDVLDEGKEEIVIPDTGEDTESNEEEEEVSEKTGIKRPRKNSDGIVKAGKRKSRQIYNDGKVYTKENGFVKQNKTNSKRQEEFLELVASKKSANIREGIISGVEEQGDKDKVIMACISYGDYFNVIIPIQLLCDVDLQPPEVQKEIKEGDKEAKNKAFRKIANGMLGAKVTFRVLEVNETSAVALADHLQAMSREGRYHYATPQRDGKPILVPGMKVEANVMAVNRIGMWIEACGAEAFIKADEIDWLRRNDFTSEYAPGDSVTVKIVEIHPKEVTYTVRQATNKLNVVSLKASIKQCVPNPNEAYYDMYNVGDVGTGSVTQVTDSGVFVIFRERISVLVDMPSSGDIPEIGDLINVKLRQKVDNGCLFFGQTNRILKKHIN